MPLSNLQTCKIKPAEQNLVKLYDPIGMTPLTLPGLFCSTFCIPFVIAKPLGDFLLHALSHKKDNFYTIIEAILTPLIFLSFN